MSAPVARGGHGKCFAAGTQVATMTGPKPIESLKVGDQVLSQDTVTGVLSYQPIVGLHHNPPAETVRIRLKDETVVSTPVHRFWRPGRGWAMARDLKPGDSIRTFGGRAEVFEIKPEAVQPVFNVTWPATTRSSSGRTRCWCAITAFLPRCSRPSTRSRRWPRSPGIARAGRASPGRNPSGRGRRGCLPAGGSSGVGGGILPRIGRGRSSARGRSSRRSDLRNDRRAG